MLLSQLLKPASMMMWIIGTCGHGSVRVHTLTTVRLMDCVILSVRILPTRLKLIWYVRHVIIVVPPVPIVPAVIHALRIGRYQHQLYAPVWIITISWVKVVNLAIIHVKHVPITNTTTVQVVRMLCIVPTIVVRNSVHVIVDMRMWRKVHVWRYVVMVHCMIMNVMMGTLLMMMDVIVCVRLRSILLVMEVVLQIVILWQI